MDRAARSSLQAHCCLEWDRAYVSFCRNERPVLTTNAAVVRGPINLTSVDLWRKYEMFLEPIMRALA